MEKVSVKELLEAGAHFGHQTSFWHPKMKRYIFTRRNGIHIVDLEQTVTMLDKACGYVRDLVAEGKSIIFVSTKRQAQQIVEEEANRCEMYYVNQRWLGGLLTNFATIQSRIDLLVRLEDKRDKGDLDSLPKKETSKLVEECKQHGVTVNSALNTAFLAASNDVRGALNKKIMVPVNTRKHYKKPIGDHFGVYVSGFELKLSYNAKKDFWENAKIFNEKARENLYIEKIFKFAAITDIIDQTIVDARQFSFFGPLVPSSSSRYEKIHAFSSNEKNVINKRAKKQIPGLPGLAITNLGRLDYPTQYGSLELDRFILITSGTPYIELVIPVVTVAGKLTFTINYLEGTTDTPTMEKIKNKVLEYLCISV